MELLDPTTGSPLTSNAIQRVLFVAPTVHVYDIPPRPSMRGYNAVDWTCDPARHIFTARLRLVETADSDSSPSTTAQASTADDRTNLKIDLVLEDPSDGQLFAAAPYKDAAVVESVLDSSRFFAVTVQDGQGHKAVLGIGFEDRSDAFDLAVALQEARRSLGWDLHPKTKPRGNNDQDHGKDYSLKDGETITINIGKIGTGQRQSQGSSTPPKPNNLQSFAIPPPPSANLGTALAPPARAEEEKRRRRSLHELGFDDGLNGEFA